MTYDYAYSGYASGYDDGLRIDISTNCGTSWDSIYGAFGPNLQTVPYESSAWTPTCGSWATDSINLSNLGLNGDTIMFRFAAINGYGNHFYLDNINVNGLNILFNEEKNEMFSQTKIYPNPSNGNINIKTNIDKLQIKIYSSLGELITEKNIEKNVKSIDFNRMPKGIYLIQLINQNNTEARKFIIQ